MRLVRAMLVVAAVFTYPILTARSASAQDRASTPDPAALAEARAAFARGTAAYEAGRFEEALAEFRHAYEITGSPDLVYNIATVLDRLRRDEEALDAYESYLEQRPESEDRANIEARIAALRAAIAARAPTATEPEGEGSGEATRAEDEISDPETTPDAGATAPTPSQGNDAGAAPWVLVGVGGALVAGGIVLLALSAVDMSTVENGTRWSDIHDAYDRVPIFSGIGFAAVGVGAAAILGGVIWALVGGARSGANDDGPRVAVGLGSIAVTGRF